MTIDPRDGVVVTVPPATRRGWTSPEPHVEAFLRERAGWVLRHVDAQARERDSAIARGGARDGGLVPFLGELHRIRVVPAPPGRGAVPARPSTISRTRGEGGPELVVALTRRERRPVERILQAWLRERAQAAIDAAVARYAPPLGVQPRRIDLRDPKSRWGSANRSGRLMLSWRLILGPPASLETVVVHELAHLRVFGHGPAFWSLVAAHRPSHLADRAWLRRNSFALHSALEPLQRTEAAVPGIDEGPG